MAIPLRELFEMGNTSLFFLLKSSVPETGGGCLSKSPLSVILLCKTRLHIFKLLSPKIQALRHLGSVQEAMNLFWY